MVLTGGCIMEVLSTLGTLYGIFRILVAIIASVLFLFVPR